MKKFCASPHYPERGPGALVRRSPHNLEGNRSQWLEPLKSRKWRWRMPGNSMQKPVRWHRPWLPNTTLLSTKGEGVALPHTSEENLGAASAGSSCPCSPWKPWGAGQCHILQECRPASRCRPPPREPLLWLALHSGHRRQEAFREPSGAATSGGHCSRADHQRVTEASSVNCLPSLHVTASPQQFVDVASHVTKPKLWVGLARGMLGAGSCARAWRGLRAQRGRSCLTRAPPEILKRWKRKSRWLLERLWLRRKIWL